MGEKMKKLLIFLLLFLSISLIGVFGFLMIKNNKLENTLNYYNEKNSKIIEQGSNKQSIVKSKEDELTSEIEKYTDLYKEYELWQKMNQSVTA